METKIISALVGIISAYPYLIYTMCIENVWSHHWSFGGLLLVMLIALIIPGLSFVKSKVKGNDE